MGRLHRRRVLDGDYVFDGESWVWDDYAGEYIDNSYYTGDEYVSMLDSNRDYKKCRSWNHGRGRVAMNFDDYSSARSGYRVYSKWPNRPWFWNAFGLRTSDASVLGDKQIETGHEHASGHRTKADADRAEAKAKAGCQGGPPELTRAERQGHPPYVGGRRVPLVEPPGSLHGESRNHVGSNRKSGRQGCGKSAGA